MILIKIYLYTSLAILSLYLIGLILGKLKVKLFIRDITFTQYENETKLDKLRKNIKNCIRCFIPIFRWLVVWSIYVIVTYTDDEFKEFLDKGNVDYKVTDKENTND